jgi:hypothetical protein
MVERQQKYFQKMAIENSKKLIYEDSIQKSERLHLKSVKILREKSLV